MVNAVLIGHAILVTRVLTTRRQSVNESLKYMNETQKNEFRYGEKIISHYDLTNTKRH